jgi:hypothetical protein
MEAEVRAQAERIGDPLEVREDLGLLAVRALPLRVRRERVRVEMRRHVTRGARIRVLAPGTADALALLEDEEVMKARLAELDTRAQSGEPRADDDRIEDGHGSKDTRY